MCRPVIKPLITVYLPKNGIILELGNFFNRKVGQARFENAHNRIARKSADGNIRHAQQKFD